MTEPDYTLECGRRCPFAPSGAANANSLFVTRHSFACFTLSQVEILSEQERPGHWRYQVQVLDDAGVLRQHTLTLSWADYNLWSSDGSEAPSRVADAALNFLLSREAAPALPAKFDCSLARRRHAEADRVIPTLIGR